MEATSKAGGVCAQLPAATANAIPATTFDISSGRVPSGHISLIRRRTFYPPDHDRFHGRFACLQPQPELLLDCGEDRRPAGLGQAGADGIGLDPGWTALL